MLMNQWRLCAECKTKHLVATDRVLSRSRKETVANAGAMDVLLEHCWTHFQVRLRILLQGELWIHRRVQVQMHPLLQQILLCFFLHLDSYVALDGVIWKHAIGIHVQVVL